MKKLRWIKECSLDGENKCKIGEEFNAGDKSADNFVSQGYAEYVDEQKKMVEKKDMTESEYARYLQDEYTLSKNDRKGGMFTETDLKILNVLPENFERWKEEYAIKKHVQDIRKNIDDWVCEWNDNRIECIAKMKKIAEGSKIYSFSELKEWVLEIIKEKKKQEVPETKTVESEKETSKKIFTSRASQAEIFMKEFPIYYDGSGLWWMWKKEGLYWEKVDEIDILNIINDATGVDIITPKNRIEIINTLKQEGRKNKPLDIKPTWIQFKNQVVDIMTGERFPASPRYFVTNPIPYRLNEMNFECTPVMDRIFEEWVGRDYVKTLYQIIAYCLLPDYPINRLFCFVGAGLNGKSKFLELLTKFIGEKNCATTELDTLLNSRFEVTRLHKKLVCQMGETNFNEMTKTSILKKLTGGDLIGFEYKGKNPFSEKNYAKIIISTNNLPSTNDKTLGFYRRWFIIDFPNQFSEKKDILAEIPEEEYECLALKCCIILKELVEKREFHNEGSIDERMEKFEQRSDFLKHFMEELVDESDPDGFISVYDFKSKFSDWCKENRHRIMADTTLSKKLKERGYELGKKYIDDWNYEGKTKQIRVFFGIKWKV